VHHTQTKQNINFELSTFAIIPARPPQTILLVMSAAPFVADDDADIVGVLLD